MIAFEALNMGLADEIVRGRIDGGMTHEGIVAEEGGRGGELYGVRPFENPIKGLTTFASMSKWMPRRMGIQSLRLN